jgi:hypothetical protein
LLRYWDAETGKPIGPLLDHGANLSRGYGRGGGGGVRFAPGGGYALSYGEFARVWPVPEVIDGDPGDLMAGASVLVGMEKDEGRGLTHLDPGRWAELLQARGRVARPAAGNPPPADWHDRNAMDCQRRGMPKAAL